MNIPDEVIAAAMAEVLDKPCASLPSLTEYDSHNEEDVMDARQTVSRAATVIAEWARREALREAAEAVLSERLIDETGDNSDDAYNQAICDGVRAIRALAEGEQG